MTAGDLWLPKVFCGLMAALFAVSAAFFAFWEALRDDDHEPVREWFRTKWTRLRQNPWLRMPETCVWWFLDGQEGLFRWLGELYDHRSYMRFALIAWPTVGAVSGYLNWGIWGAVILFLAACPTAVVALMDRVADYMATVVGVFFVIQVFATYASLGLSVVRLPTGQACLLMVAALPVCFILGYFAVGALVATGEEYRGAKFRRISDDTWKFRVAAAFSLSFLLTLFSFLVGHFSHPSSYVPQTFQMLFSNAVCDALTLLATIAILAWAVRERVLFRLPFAILCDITIAAVLAVLSLYLGLVFTKHALTLAQVAGVLVGRSPTGQDYEFGPCFWAMHTTFIPTLVYLSITLIAWLGKAILSPVTWFLGKGHENRNPLKLTAAVMGLLFALCGVAAYGLGSGEEYLKDHPPTTGRSAPPAPTPGDSAVPPLAEAKGQEARHEEPPQ